MEKNLEKNDPEQFLGFFGQFAQILALQHIKHVILSPGSRVAPITLAFARHPDIQTHIQIDERSAGYLALGMATQFLSQYQSFTQNSIPNFVALACTSGTAVLNYMPAIAEAFYQNIPILILTADRPPEWINQKDGQAIQQNHVFSNFVKKSFVLPTNTQHPDIDWHANRLLNEALLALKTPPFQPIHINIPIREPFYPEPTAQIDFFKKPRIIYEFLPEKTPKKEDWILFRELWDNADRKLMLVGQCFPDTQLQKYVSEIAQETNTPVIVEILSNFHENNPFFIRNFDIFSGKLTENESKMLTPDLLITWGEGVLSKGLKGFFRKNKTINHIHIQEAGEVADTFQSITHILRINPIIFFKKLAEELDFDAFLHKDLSDDNSEAEEYAELWQKYNKNAEIQAYNFINHKENQQKFYEFIIIENILSYIPPNTNVHLANSMSVRYANYWNFAPSLQKNVSVYSNRGTSGIDGCTSTALGFALADKSKLNVLITGDLAFFYDRNAFFRKEIPKNLCVMVLNNQGGNIFRFVEGANKQPELVEFFETPHDFDAMRTAQDAKMDYFSAKTYTELHTHLQNIFSENISENGNFERQNACILEIFTDKKENEEAFRKFKNW